MTSNKTATAQSVDYTSREAYAQTIDIPRRIASKAGLQAIAKVTDDGKVRITEIRMPNGANEFQATFVLSGKIQRADVLWLAVVRLRSAESVPQSARVTLKPAVVKAIGIDSADCVTTITPRGTITIVYQMPDFTPIVKKTATATATATTTDKAKTPPPTKVTVSKPAKAAYEASQKADKPIERTIIHQLPVNNPA